MVITGQERVGGEEAREAEVKARVSWVGKEAGLGLEREGRTGMWGDSRSEGDEIRMKGSWVRSRHEGEDRPGDGRRQAAKCVGVRQGEEGRQ